MFDAEGLGLMEEAQLSIGRTRGVAGAVAAAMRPTYSYWKWEHARGATLHVCWKKRNRGGDVWIYSRERLGS